MAESELMNVRVDLGLGEEFSLTVSAACGTRVCSEVIAVDVVDDAAASAHGNPCSQPTPFDTGVDPIVRIVDIRGGEESTRSSWDCGSIACG